MAHSCASSNSAFAIAFLSSTRASGRSVMVAAPLVISFLGAVIPVGRACTGANKISRPFDKLAGEQDSEITHTRNNSSERAQMKTTRDTIVFRMLPWMPRANVVEEVLRSISVKNPKKWKNPEKSSSAAEANLAVQMCQQVALGVSHLLSHPPACL